MKSPSVPSIADPQAVAELRQAFAAADYTSAGAKEALQAEGETFIPQPHEIPIIVQGLPEHTTLSTLIKLFIVGLAMGREETQSALAPLSLERAAALGIVKIHADRVEPLVNIVPFRDLLFSFDLAEGDVEEVMGISPSSILLANLTPRERTGTALDLGVGCGFQALLAAAHSTKVIATDANPRAVDFTRFNVLLNDVHNVEVLHGSWFEPIEHMKFDLIVSNPPFVVSPDFQFLFRDSEGSGDAVSSNLVRTVPEYLNDGGVAMFLMSWIVRVGEDWREPLRRWTEKTGCDAWFLRASTEEPLAYATGWNKHLRDDPVAYTSTFNRWIEYFRAERVEAIGYGAAVLRKRSGPNWIRMDELEGSPVEPAGGTVAALVRVEDQLWHMAGGQELLTQKPRLTANHRLEQILRMRDGGYVVEGAALQLEEGLFFRADMDPFKANLISRLDGKRTLRAAIADAQAVLAPEANEEDFIRMGLLVAEQMLRLGFLRLDDLQKDR